MTDKTASPDTSAPPGARDLPPRQIDLDTILRGDREVIITDTVGFITWS